MACSARMQPEPDVTPGTGAVAITAGGPAAPWKDRAPRAEALRLDPGTLCRSVVRLDALAVAVAAAMHRIARPIAIAASEVCLDRVWTRLGYARAEDFARERLDRTGRWLRDMAALGRSSWSTDRLLAAVDGSDGKPPLGTVAAVAIARFQPSDDALPTWVALGRALSLRELRQRLRHARTAGSHHPVDASGRPDLSLRPPDPIIEWMAQLSPESLSGPAFCEAAALPWNRRYLESIGLRAGNVAESDPAGGAEQPVPDAGQDARLLDDDSRPGPDSRQDGAPRFDDALGLDEDREPLLRIRIDLPAPVVAAFHEARRLHERVVRQRTSTADFTDALVAEARASGLDVRPDMNGAFDRLCATRVLDDPEREAAWDRRRQAWRAEELDREASDRFPPGPGPGPESKPEFDEAEAQLIARAGELAERARALLTNPFDRDAAAAARRLQALLALERELRRALGELLGELRVRRAWRALGFHCIRHYAEARLGMSRSSAEDAARLASALQRLPVLKEAYDTSRLSAAAALRVVRVLGRNAAPSDLQRYWAEHAATATIKRLDDERNLLRERRLLGTADPLAPVSDPDWHASLGRASGDSAARLRAHARLAAERSGDVVPLLLVLPFSRAADFLGALGAATRRVQTFSADTAPFDARWLGLVALLTAYAAVHDEHRGRAGVYARDGWRCMAPGCTSHANLEDHHVQYRSRDGDDAPGNRVTLCRFHHQRGEHGGAMRVRGRAPLGLEFVLDGEIYRNERRIDRQVARPRGLEPLTS